MAKPCLFLFCLLGVLVCMSSCIPRVHRVPKGAEPVLNTRGKPTGKYRVKADAQQIQRSLTRVQQNARYVQVNTTYVMKDAVTKRIIPLDARFAPVVERWKAAPTWWTVGTYDESRLEFLRTVTFLDAAKSPVWEIPDAVDGLLYGPRSPRKWRRGAYHDPVHDLEQLYPVLKER